MGRRRPTKPEAPELAQTLHGAVVEATLDLHGRNAAQALRRVETFLDLWARQSPGAVLRIITGKGNRSAGAPVLRSKVGDLMVVDLFSCACRSRAMSFALKW